MSKKKPISDLLPDLQMCLEAEIGCLKQKLTSIGEFDSADSERLGRATRLFIALAEASRKEAEAASKKGSGLASEDMLRALCKEEGFRNLVMSILAEYV